MQWAGLESLGTPLCSDQGIGRPGVAAEHRHFLYPLTNPVTTQGVHSLVKAQESHGFPRRATRAVRGTYYSLRSSLDVQLICTIYQGTKQTSRMMLSLLEHYSRV
jgi:hypothetical protein